MKLLIVTIVVALIPVCANAQSYASFNLAREVAHLLERRSMSAFVAGDPQEAGRFIAALYIPRRELRVVSARHPSPDTLAQPIRQGAYTDVYFELRHRALQQGQVFIQDAEANGLLHALPGSGVVDIVSEDGVTTRFNGDPKSQHLLAPDYDARFKRADSLYAEALSRLKTALEKSR